MPDAPQNVHHRRQESAASGRPASMRRQSSGLNNGALIDDLGIQTPEDEESAPHSPTGRRSESSNSAFGVKRKPVPNFSATRDASAAYTHAASDSGGGNLIDVTSSASAAGHDSEFHDAFSSADHHDDVNPFADPQAPSAAFTVQRHHDASGQIMGKSQHALDVDGPTAY